MLQRITDAWQETQPHYLRHLAVIKDAALQFKYSYFRYRSFNNFVRVVAIGLASWEGVSLKSKKGPYVANIDRETHLDKWGFPMIPAGQLVDQKGTASLSRSNASLRPSERNKKRSRPQEDVSISKQSPGLTRLPREQSSLLPENHVPKSRRSLALRKPQVESKMWKTFRASTRMMARRAAIAESPTTSLHLHPTEEIHPPTKRIKYGEMTPYSEGFQDVNAIRIIQDNNDRVGPSVEDSLELVDTPSTKRHSTSEALDQRPAKRSKFASGTSFDIEQRIDQLHDGFVNMTLPGVYINPPVLLGSGRGRPRNTLLVVIKHNALKSLPWFEANHEDVEAYMPIGPPKRRQRRSMISKTQRLDSPMAIQIGRKKSQIIDEESNDDTSDDIVEVEGLVGVEDQPDQMHMKEAANAEHGSTRTVPNHIAAEVPKIYQTRTTYTGSQNQEADRGNEPLASQASPLPNAYSTCSPSQEKSPSTLPDRACESIEADFAQKMHEHSVLVYQDRSPTSTFSGNKDGVVNDSGRLLESASVEKYPIMDAPPNTYASESFKTLPSVSTEPNAISDKCTIIERAKEPSISWNDKPQQSVMLTTNEDRPDLPVTHDGTYDTTFQVNRGRPRTPSPEQRVSRILPSVFGDPDIDVMTQRSSKSIHEPLISSKKRPSHSGRTVQESTSMGPSEQSKVMAAYLPYGPLRTPRKSKGTGVSLGGGSIAFQRSKIILDIVEKCGGVYPGDREIWYPFTTIWRKLHETIIPDTGTVERAVTNLVNSGKLRRLKFVFRKIIATQPGIKSIVTLPDIPFDCAKVKECEQRMVEQYPRLYIPEAVDVDIDLERNGETAISASWRAKNRGGISGCSVTISRSDRNTHAPTKIRVKPAWQLWADGDENVDMKKALQSKSAPISGFHAEALTEAMPEEELKSHDLPVIHPRQRVIPPKTQGKAAKLKEPRVQKSQPSTHSAQNGADIESGDDEEFVSEEQKSMQATFQLSTYQHDPEPEGQQRVPGKRLSRIVRLYDQGRTAETAQAVKLANTAPRGSQAVLHGFVDLQITYMTTLSLSDPGQGFHPSTGTFSTGMRLLLKTHSVPPSNLMKELKTDKKAKSISQSKIKFDIPRSLHEMLSQAERRSPISKHDNSPYFFTEVDLVEKWEKDNRVELISTEQPDRIEYINHTVDPEIFIAAPEDITYGGLSFEDGRSTNHSQGNKRGLREKMKGRRMLGNNTTFRPLAAALKSGWSTKNPPTGVNTIDCTEETPLFSMATSARIRKARSIDVRRLVASVVIVKTVLGGQSRSIDWPSVLKVWQERFDFEVTKKAWSTLHEQFQSQIDAFENGFREFFLRSYANGMIPAMDFDNIDIYDWNSLTDLALSEIPLNLSTISQPYVNVDTKSDEQSAAQRQYVPRSVAKEFMGQVTTIVRRRDILMSVSFSFMSQISASSMHSDGTRLDGEDCRRDLIKTHVRANVFTPRFSYNAVLAQQKLSAFDESELDIALRSLLQAKVIKSDSLKFKKAGRRYSLHENFLDAFRKNAPIADASTVKIASTFKQYLDKNLTDGREIECTFDTSDGEMIAILNMAAHGRIDLKLGIHGAADTIAGIPEASNQRSSRKLSKWGFTNGDYRTVQPTKQDLILPVRIKPTSDYIGGLPLEQRLPAIAFRSKSIPHNHVGKIPYWSDIHANLLPDIWTRTFNMILGTLALRPATSGHVMWQEIGDASGTSAWELEEALLVASESALVRPIRVKGIGAGLEGLNLQEWWWCVFGSA